MALDLDPKKIEAVLLMGDKWRDVRPRSFETGAGNIAGGRPEGLLKDRWFRFTDEGTEDTLAGPMASLVAVRYIMD